MKIVDKIRIKAKHAIDAAPVKIAILGDSVSHGCFETYLGGGGVYDHAAVYHSQLKARMEAVFPSCPVAIINAAIGGTAKSLEMTEMLTSHAYRVYDWNVVTNDAVLYTAPYGTDTYDYIRDTFLSTFDARIAEGKTPIIILMHETVPETIDLMPWMIETLIDRGYTFGTLDTIRPWMFGTD